MTFPKNGDDSFGTKSLLLAKDSFSLAHMHHWRAETVLRATRQVHLYSVIGCQYIGENEGWRSGSWAWP